MPSFCICRNCVDSMSTSLVADRATSRNDAQLFAASHFGHARGGRGPYPLFLCSISISHPQACITRRNVARRTTPISRSLSASSSS